MIPGSSLSPWKNIHGTGFKELKELFDARKAENSKTQIVNLLSSKSFFEWL